MESYAYYRKAFDVAGWTFNGEIYCVDHKPEGVTVEGDESKPIFVSDLSDFNEEQPHYCSCGRQVD